MDDYVVKIYVHIDERAISFLVIVLLQVKYEMVDVKTSNHWYAIPASVT
jgi:2-succinyl-5-enolpyruvyl-6-hydroxy-3-cyclohexene-1-carboxylate synthase